MNKAGEAAIKWLKRKKRQEHPDGYFDKAKRWYPGIPEWQECCKDIRQPSASFPYSKLVHCRSAEHVAALMGVTAQELKHAAYILERFEDIAEQLIDAVWIAERSLGKSISTDRIKRMAERIREVKGENDGTGDKGNVGGALNQQVGRAEVR